MDDVAVDAKRILLRYGAPINVLDDVSEVERIELARLIAKTHLPDRERSLRQVLADRGYMEPPPVKTRRSRSKAAQPAPQVGAPGTPLAVPAAPRPGASSLTAKPLARPTARVASAKLAPAKVTPATVTPIKVTPAKAAPAKAVAPAKAAAPAKPIPVAKPAPVKAALKAPAKPAKPKPVKAATLVRAAAKSSARPKTKGKAKAPLRGKPKPSGAAAGKRKVGAKARAPRKTAR